MPRIRQGIALLALCTGLAGAERGRVRIQDNTVVSDQGTLLRGGHFQLDQAASLARIGMSAWLEYRALGANVMRVTYDGNGEGALRPAPALDVALRLIDSAVERGARAGMYVKIEYARHSPGARPDSVDCVNFWKAVAPRYKDRTHVLYAVANEPVAWEPEDYTAADVRFQEEMFLLIRSMAPSTHIFCWGFSSATGETFETVAKGARIDYSNASVDFHAYGVLSERVAGWRELRAHYPVYAGEFTYAPWASQNLEPDEVIRFIENEGISWSSLCFDGTAPYDSVQGLWVGDGQALGIAPRTRTRLPVTRSFRRVDLLGRVQQRSYGPMGAFQTKAVAE